MTPKTAPKAAVFCRLPTDRQLLMVHKSLKLKLLFSAKVYELFIRLRINVLTFVQYTPHLLNAELFN
jgi:hypothetical protein